MNTILGEMDEALLEKKVIDTEVNGNQLRRVEYWYQGQEVRSDLDITPAQLSLVGEQEQLTMAGNWREGAVMSEAYFTLTVEDLIKTLQLIENKQYAVKFSSIFKHATDQGYSQDAGHIELDNGQVIVRFLNDPINEAKLNKH